MSVDDSQYAAVSFVDIDSETAGQRIDNFLLARLKGVPKSRIYRLLRKGEVRVNKGRIKPEYRLLAGDQLRLPPIRVAERGAPPPASQGLRSELLSSIVRQNDDWLVLNKPSGLAVHGGSGVSLGAIEALRNIWPDARHLELVHRLDRDTSGCLLITKKRAALRDLQEQMRAGSITKKYLALVVGNWPKGLTVVDAPLLKNTLSSGERVVRADSAGKAAVTHFKVLKTFAGFTLLEVTLETGRTHQIRVHCQLMGHPIAGDPKYGDKTDNKTFKTLGLKRLFLHAAKLGFKDPLTAERLVCEAPLPEELDRVLTNLPGVGC